MYIGNNKLYIIGIDKNKTENGTMYYSIEGKQKTAKLHYMPVKCWQQYYAGNYGLYFTARYNGGKNKKRVYICSLPEYR